MAAEKLIKTAGTGGARVLKPPKLRKEDCYVEKLKEATDFADFRQWVR